MALDAIDSSEMRKCIDCNVGAPATDTNYTLISAMHGWRLSTRRTATGEAKLEWRCPHCWTAYRSAGGKLRGTL